MGDSGPTTDFDRLSTVPAASVVGVTVSLPGEYMEPTEYIPAESSPTHMHQVSGISLPAEFIFMDVGAWRREQYSFGVIHGRHAYLCRYTPNEQGLAPTTHMGLDDQFFSAFGNRVQVDRRASAQAPDQDFDWNKIYVVIPDIHLMTGRAAAIWLDVADLEPETSFSKFARDLSELPTHLRENIHLVQTGDMYDLWVGYPCLFEQTASPQIALVNQPDVVSEIGRWIEDIRSDNPGAAAFELLEKSCGQVTYIYGNHDCYLVLPHCTHDWRLPQREPYLEGRGVFLEHGHRFEVLFPAGFPGNRDGDVSGWRATAAAFGQLESNSPGVEAQAYKAGLDVWWAETNQRPMVLSELAKLWAARRAGSSVSRPIHIFVTAHTHAAALQRIQITRSRTRS